MPPDHGHMNWLVCSFRMSNGQAWPDGAAGPCGTESPGGAAARIEELFRAGRKDEAADAMPDEFVDEQALVGTPDRIRERYRAWADCGITGLHVGTRQAAAVEVMAEIAAAGEPASRAG